MPFLLLLLLCNEAFSQEAGKQQEYALTCTHFMRDVKYGAPIKELKRYVSNDFPEDSLQAIKMRLQSEFDNNGDLEYYFIEVERELPYYHCSIYDPNQPYPHTGVFFLFEDTKDTLIDKLSVYIIQNKEEDEFDEVPADMPPPPAPPKK